MKKLVVTDLDDTLYSWIDFFVPAFYEMVEAISGITGIAKEILLSEYKEVHRRCGSVEYPYATLYLPSIKKKYESLGEAELKEILNEAFHRFNSYRKHNLKLYPGVYDTLHTLHEKGIKIIGYTDSAEENGYYRLKKLGIDDLFEKIYLSNSCFRKDAAKLEKLEFVDTKKPDPATLLQICQKENIETRDTVYIGDSMTKDIYMAYCAGIDSVWMHVQKEASDLYDKLVAISHWTGDDFAREEAIKQKCAKEGIKPDYAIDDFRQVLDIVLSMKNAHKELPT